MRELGETAVSLHHEIGTFVTQLRGIDAVWTVGTLARSIQDGLGKKMPGMHFEDRMDLAAILPQLLQPNDTIFFKASKGSQLWKLVQTILETSQFVIGCP